MLKLDDITIICDSCGVGRSTTGLVPWAHGEYRRVCPECFLKEFGITIEEKIKQEDAAFKAALDRICSKGAKDE